MTFLPAEQLVGSGTAHKLGQEFFAHFKVLIGKLETVCSTSFMSIIYWTMIHPLMSIAT